MARSPYVISLIDLPRQEGAHMVWEQCLRASEDIGVEMIGVRRGEDIDIRLTLASVSEGVYVSGVVTTPVHGQCSRCLRDIDTEIREDIAELVLYPERYDALVAQGDEDASQAHVVVDEQIDIEPIIRDAIVLSLPFVPVCREDCRGLCPECGNAFDDMPDNHHHEAPYDGRFDALAALEARMRESGQ